MKRSAFAVACARYPEHAGPRDRELVAAASLTIPGLRLVSEANAHEHHWRRVKRAQQQGADVRLHLSATWGVGTGRRLVLPLEVRLVRIAPRSLDQGNREGCFKHVQDEIAAWLGVDDRHEELVRYRYEQERGAAKTYGVRIEIRPAKATGCDARSDATTDGSERIGDQDSSRVPVKANGTRMAQTR